jgi:hypothetical protein
LEVLGHLLLEDLLQDGLDALPYPGLHVSLHVVLEFLLRGQVCLLHSTHNLSDATCCLGFNGCWKTLRVRINAIRYLLLPPLPSVTVFTARAYLPSGARLERFCTSEEYRRDDLVYS